MEWIDRGSRSSSYLFYNSRRSVEKLRRSKKERKETMFWMSSHGVILVGSLLAVVNVNADDLTAGTLTNSFPCKEEEFE